MRVILRFTLPGKGCRILQEERLFTLVAPSARRSRKPAFMAAIVVQLAAMVLVIQVGDRYRSIREAELAARTFYVQTSSLRLHYPAAAEDLPTVVSEKPLTLPAPRAAASSSGSSPAPLPPAPRRTELFAIAGEPPALATARPVLQDKLPDLWALLSPETEAFAPQVAATAPLESPYWKLSGLFQPSADAFWAQPDAGGDGKLGFSLSAHAGRLSRGLAVFTSRIFGVFHPEEAHAAAPRLARVEVVEDRTPSPDPESAHGAEMVRQLFPADGAYDLVVLHSSGAGAIPGSTFRLNGQPVYSVTLPVTGPQRWSLQFVVTGTAPGRASQGTTSYISTGPVEAPWPLEVTLSSSQPQSLSRIAISGRISADGRWSELSVVEGGDTAGSLLLSLSNWKFRPATQGGAPITVEALLVAEPF